MKRLLVLLAAGATLGVAGPATAEAANPYTAQEICGAGYKVKLVNRSNPYAWGYLMRKPGTQQYCTTSIKRKFIGKETFIGVRVEQFYGGSYADRDAGNFRYYAGPLRWDASGDTCFNVKGNVASGGKGLKNMGFIGVGPCNID